MRTRTIVAVGFAVAIAAAQTNMKTALTTAQRKWLKKSRFDCMPGEGLMTSWRGQPGKQDHQDTQAIAGEINLLCRAMAASGGPDPACYVIFQHSSPLTIPSHGALPALKGADVITLTCNGKLPTCCQLRLVSPRKEGEEPPKLPNLPKRKSSDEI